MVVLAVGLWAFTAGEVEVGVGGNRAVLLPSFTPLLLLLLLSLKVLVVELVAVVVLVEVVLTLLLQLL